MAETNPPTHRGHAEASSAGRIIGALMLAQMVCAFFVNFVLQSPLFGAPGFLVNAAPHSLQISLSVLLGLATGALLLGISIAAFPVFRQYTQAMALWLVALAVVSLAVTAVENIGVRSMLSLSEAYAKASAADRDQFEGLRVVVSSARNWAHYIGLIIAGCTLFVLYAVLYRFALVPRALAAFGLAAVALQIAAVAMPLFGHNIVFLLLAPLGVSQLLLAVWLIAKGLRDQVSPGM
jgi:hypothetical protein